MNPMGPQWKSSWPSPAAITQLLFCVFAGRADAEVYRTLKISSGRGSKCSGKKHEKTKTWLGKSRDLTPDLHCSNGVAVKCLEEIGCLTFE